MSVFTKRIVGVGLLHVAPTPDYNQPIALGSAVTKPVPRRDEAWIDVTHEFARSLTYPGREVGDVVSAVLVGLQSTAYTVEYRYRGRTYLTSYPHRESP
jgi:hypothetical protein